MKKLVALLLIMAVLLSVLPTAGISAYADEVETEVTETATEETVVEDTEETTEAPSEESNYVIPEANNFKSKDITFLYVSPDGDDTNDGSIDAPIKTIERAKNLVRELRSKQQIGKDGVTVYFREGSYAMDKYVQFTQNDSGTAEAPVTYKSYPGETAKFVGGIDIPWSDFQPVKDGAVLNRLIDQSVRDKLYYINIFDYGVTEIPEQYLKGNYSYYGGMSMIIGHGDPGHADSELIVNGAAQTVARYPNDSVMQISDIIVAGATPRQWEDDRKGTPQYVQPEDRVPTPFTIQVADSRIARWTGATQALIYGTFYYSWADQTVPLQSVDPANMTITSKYPSEYSVQKGQHFYVYDLIEEIDMPGEYFLDRETGNLYYYPIEGKINSVQYTLLGSHMFNFNNVSYINFEDFDIGYTTAGFIRFTDADHIEIINCKFHYSGAGAVGGNGNELRFANCEFVDVNGGISLRGGDLQTLTNSNNTVENCTFLRCDRLKKTYNYAVVNYDVGSIVRYNDLSDAEHTIIGIGGNNHIVAFNDISNACWNADDMGAFYCGRDITARGNKVVYNYFHDIGGEEKRGEAGVHAIFLDDWFSWVHIAGNVIENVKGFSIFLAGSHNVVHNNMFINVEEESVRCERSFAYGNADSEYSFRQKMAQVPYDGEIWRKAYPEIKDIIDENGNLDMNRNIRITNNVFYKTPEPVVAPYILNTATIEGNQSYTNDPGFYDLSKRNYLLKEDAKVYKDIEGFLPIPFTRMGTYTERAMTRMKNSMVFMADSDQYIIKGKLKELKTALKPVDGKLYIPVETVSLYLGGVYNRDENSGDVTVIATTAQFSLKNADLSKAKLNGEDKVLKDGAKEIGGELCMSLYDIADCFGLKLLVFDNIAVLTDNENILSAEGDSELITYYKDTLSIY